MFDETLYVEAKLSELRRKAAFAERRNTIEPGSEVARAGVGRVHEVFRRIVQDAEPRNRPRFGWLRA